MPSCVVAKGSRRACITSGRKIFLEARKNALTRIVIEAVEQLGQLLICGAVFALLFFFDETKAAKRDAYMVDGVSVELYAMCLREQVR